MSQHVTAAMNHDVTSDDVMVVRGEDRLWCLLGGIAAGSKAQMSHLHPPHLLSCPLALTLLTCRALHPP